MAGQVQDCLDALFADQPDGPVTEAMAYAARGGKRLRAFLVMESAHLHGISDEKSVYAAAAVELLHAYSLVHDDLPAMDDDDLRRGQPTVHVKWDEATAILVGDALQALAFELLCHKNIGAGPAAQLALVRSMAVSVGGAGMVRGQALDIAAETAEPRYGLDLVEETQALKTGALIEWSAAAGAILAAAEDGALRAYARDLGRAFQIADDILDVTGDEAATGKRVGKDAGAGKATFVSLLGLDGARARAEALVERACGALACYGAEADNLREAARFVIARQS